MKVFKDKNKKSGEHKQLEICDCCGKKVDFVSHLTIDEFSVRCCKNCFDKIIKEYAKKN